MTDNDSSEISELHGAMTPAAVVKAFADRGVIFSERKLRELARRIGACRIIGKAMFLTPRDIEAILEAAKPPAKASRRHPVSTWTEEDTEKLCERIAQINRGKGRKKS